MAPSLLLADDLIARVSQFLLLIALIIFSRRRIRWGRTMIFFGAVVGFNFAYPVGLVLAEPFGFPVTSGALAIGFAKAVALVNLMLLSKISIRSDLQLPGRIGEIFSMTLSYLHYLLDADVKLIARDPIGRLDDLFQTAYRQVTFNNPETSENLLKPSGMCILTFFLLISWGVLLFGA